MSRTKYTNRTTFTNKRMKQIERGNWYITTRHFDGGLFVQEYLTCSNCDAQFCGSGIKEFHYCPDCGADMWGDPDEEEA